MRYAMLLAIMACAGCVGEQTKAAFTMRPPAHDPDPRALTPNKAHEHEMNLQRAIEHATEEQESSEGLHLKCHDRKFEDVDVTNCVTVPHFEFLTVCE